MMIQADSNLSKMPISYKRVISFVQLVITKMALYSKMVQKMKCALHFCCITQRKSMLATRSYVRIRASFLVQRSMCLLS